MTRLNISAAGVTVPICIAIIWSSTTQIQNSLGLDVIGKLLLAFAMFFLVFILLFTIDLRRVSRIALWAAFAGGLLIFNAISALLRGIPLDFIAISFSQLFMIYFWIIVFEVVDRRVLIASGKFAFMLTSASLLLAVAELLTPTSIKESVLLFFFNQVPVSYYSRDLSVLVGEFLRLGSFFLSPLTFAYAAVFVLVYAKSSGGRAFRYLAYFISFSSQVKTSIVGAVMLLFSKVVGSLSRLIFFSIIFLIVLVSLSTTGEELLGIDNDSPFKSLSNHLVGLVAGINSGLGSPFFGEGLGTAGYLTYLHSLESHGGFTPFNDISSYLNGNESTFGVISYQLGVGFLCLHVMILYEYVVSCSRQKNHTGCAFLLFLVVFQVLSESPLTVLVSITAPLLLAWLRRGVNG